MSTDAQITFLPTSDLSLARRFYGDQLGLQLVVDQGTCLIYRVTDGAFLGVCEREEPQTSDDVIVTLVAADVDGWCAAAAGNGVAFESGPIHSDRYGIYHAFFRDPDGNRLEVQSFDDPQWSSAP